MGNFPGEKFPAFPEILLEKFSRREVSRNFRKFPLGKFYTFPRKMFYPLYTPFHIVRCINTTQQYQHNKYMLMYVTRMYAYAVRIFLQSIHVTFVCTYLYIVTCM